MNVLESLDVLERAKVLAMASLFREQISEKLPMDCFLRPRSCARDDLIQIYKGLAGIRDQTAESVSTVEANLRRLGHSLPEYAKRHAECTRRGIEVWMATMGAVIRPETGHLA